MTSAGGGSNDAAGTFKPLLANLLLRLANLSWATESALFVVLDQGSGHVSLEAQVMVGIGEPTRQEPDALKKFEQTVKRCAEQKRDGCVYLGDGAWCLVALLMNPGGAVAGAIATITRSGSRKVAHERLRILEGRRPARGKRKP